ncbi:MAG: hypothetical protein IPO21_18495 [Bacteroidales bacterium]|nr:hypothetical protein [Bacteroidales bacterium]
MKVRLFGDEFYMRAESIDGYTLLRDTVTKWICYATINKDSSELQSTGVIYTGAELGTNPAAVALGLLPHYTLPLDVVIEKINKVKEKLGVNQPRFEQKTRQEPMPKDGIRPAPPFATKKKDIIKGLCIVVDFSDEQSYYTLPELDSMMNGKNFTGFGLNGSVYQYFNDISGGVVEFNNMMYGVFRAPKTFAEYDAMPYSMGAKEILKLAMESMDKQGFDFSTLTHDSSGYIRSITLLYLVLQLHR